MEIEWKLAITWHVINALNKGNLRLNDLSVSIKNVSLMMRNNEKKTTQLYKMIIFMQLQIKIEKKSKNDNELELKMIKLEFSFVNGIINSK